MDADTRLPRSCRLCEDVTPLDICRGRCEQRAEGPIVELGQEPPRSCPIRAFGDARARAQLRDLSERHGLTCKLVFDRDTWVVRGNIGCDPRACVLASGTSERETVNNLRLRFQPELEEATNEQLLAELQDRLNLKRPEAQELMRLANEELL